MPYVLYRKTVPYYRDLDVASVSLASLSFQSVNLSAGTGHFVGFCFTFLLCFISHRVLKTLEESDNIVIDNNIVRIVDVVILCSCSIWITGVTCFPSPRRKAGMCRSFNAIIRQVTLTLRITSCL
jgi:hypothetical protein